MRPLISWSALTSATVGIWGLGVEGTASLHRLQSMGLGPVLVDDHPASSPTEGVEVLATGAGGLAALLGCDVVIKSPGISRYRPEVEQLERGGDVEERLGVPEEQHAARVEALVEEIDDGFTRLRIEVDEHVATEDRVAPPDEPRLVTLEEVHLSEVAHRPDALHDVRAGGAIDEVRAALVLRGDTKRARAVDAATRGRDAPLRDV